MLSAGDVVTVDFPGVQGVKRRPALVVSSAKYHQTRPDVILGLLTTQLDSATAPSDYALQDWRVIGLRKPSAFRAFLVTMPATTVNPIGRVSNRDWQAIQACLKIAIAIE